MRINLKLIRIKNNLSQEQMANKLNISRSGYTYIECGRSRGQNGFWETLQKEFNISDEEMWGVMKNETKQNGEKKSRS